MESFVQVYRIYTDERVIPFLGHDAMDLETFRAVYDRLLAARDFYVVKREGKVAGMVEAAIEQMKALGIRRCGESKDVDEIVMVRFLDTGA